MILKFMIFIILISHVNLYAKELKVAFSPSTPPYVFKNGTGITMDIINESLAVKGHTLKPVFVSIGRGFELFKDGYIDATTIIKKSSGLKAFYSDYFMQYHNAVFALKSNHYTIHSLLELSDYYMIGFQNAHKYLGEKFGKVTQKAGNRYSEIADQRRQVLKLLKGHTDIVVMDRHIFKFYKQQLIAEGKVPKDIQTTLYELFSPTKYRVSFKDKALLNDFNTGLRKLKKSGRYDKIYHYYSNQYFKVKK